MATETAKPETPSFGKAVAQLRAGAAVRYARMRATSGARASTYPAKLIGPGKFNVAKGGVRVKMPSVLGKVYPRFAKGKTDEQGTPAQAA